MTMSQHQRAQTRETAAPNRKGPPAPAVARKTDGWLAAPLLASGLRADADSLRRPAAGTDPLRRHGGVNAGAGDDPLGGSPVSPEVLSALRRSRGGGRPLPAETVDQFSGRYAADLSAVRVHTDESSHRLASSLQSVAFTHGNDVYFSRGSYSPNSRSGQHLIAHELAHVAQDRSGGSSAGSLTVGRADDPAEAAADRAAERALAGGGAAGIDAPGGASTTVHRFRLPWQKKKKGTEAPPLSGGVMSDEDKGGVPDAKMLMAMLAEDKNVGDWAADLSENPDLPDAIAKKLLAKGAHLLPVNDGGWPTGDSFQVDKTIALPASIISAFESGLSLISQDDGTKLVVKNSDLTDDVSHVSEFDPVFPLGGDGKPRLPRPEDIVQGELGDCYLEAALSSLAHTNPQAIVDMVKDFGNTVAVRLFDVNRTDPQKPSFTPRFVRVQKSRARRDGELVFDQGALWVGMIEKAYAAGKFGGSQASTDLHRGQTKASMGAIADGFSHYAFEVLLGKPAGYVMISQSEGRDDFHAAGLPWADAELTEYQTNAKKKGGSYGALASMTALQDTKKVDRWMQWYYAHGNAKIVQLYETARGVGGGYAQGSIRIEDFERLFASNGLPDSIAAPMLAYLQTYFPGKRGSAKYSRAQLATWDRIIEALAAKKVVTAGSEKEIGRSSSGAGHSGGESMSRGMVGSHAFTVLDTKIDGQGRRFVKMRNPWGKYSREYDFDQTKGGRVKQVDKGDGMSWFELDDVSKRFNHISVL